ncbi:MAG: NAD-dependent epimerase/dehydratase family protein [Nitrososphaerales archaeon]
MKVLVTGASGFVGSSLVNLLVNRGNEVTCLIRNEEKKQKFEGCEVNFLVADITDRNGLLEVTKNVDVDALFHLAAINPLEKDKKVQQRVNIDGTRNILDVCLKNNIGLFVYAQGTGIFGDVKGQWIDESTPKNPDTDFTKTRSKAEEILWQANKENGLPVTVTVLGDVYGPAGWFAELIVNKLRDGSFMIPGSGDYYRSFVHVDDVANALALITEKNAKNNTYIVADDEPITFGEFVNFVAEKLGVKRPRKVPAFLAKMKLGSDMIKLLTYSVKARNVKIKKELGFALKYPTYREGVETALRGL